MTESLKKYALHFTQERDQHAPLMIVAPAPPILFTLVHLCYWYSKSWIFYFHYQRGVKIQAESETPRYNTSEYCNK